MKIKITVFVLIGLIATLFIAMASYGVNQEEAITEAKESFYTSFEIPVENDQNYESDQVTFYLPNGVKVVEETDYNIVLKQDDQIYLLFFNPLEKPNSKVHYDLDLQYQEEALLFETYETEDLCSYLLVLEEDKELNVVLGVGGAKISTITSTSRLLESTEVMTEILHSLTYKL